MLLAVLSGFILALFAPLICRVAGDRCGWVFALLPATLFVWFAGLLPEVMANGAQVVRYPWFPAMEINLDFLIDGLSLMFALLISGIGAVGALRRRARKS